MAGAFGAIFIIPMFLLNSLSGLIGGAWLIWLGDWKLVLTGVALAICAPFWTSIAILPSLIFALPSVVAMEKGQRFLALTLASLSALWSYAVVTAWCIAVFKYVPEFWHSGEPIAPFLLYAYAMATGPWALAAQKAQRSGDSDAGQFTASAACFGCALILGYVFLADRPQFTTAVWLLIVPMVAAYLLSIVIGVIESRRQTRYGF